MRPLTISGYACWPRRMPTSIARKSTLNTRPSRLMFALVICRSGECRFWSSVRPQVSQLPDTEGAAPTAGPAPESVIVSVAATAATSEATTKGLCILSLLTRTPGTNQSRAITLRPQEKGERQQARGGDVGSEGDRALPNALGFGLSAPERA